MDEWDSNSGIHVSDATALPTVPVPIRYYTNRSSLLLQIFLHTIVSQSQMIRYVLAYCCRWFYIQLYRVFSRYVLAYCCRWFYIQLYRVFK